ncbi:RIO1 family protein [Oesophagostomum dentatum]|uniref:non-specific serine/threonine protein kinase n=1 Tax=Oesophagostomum dentatum TaxID=61180 RepID=A0A0B1RS67_OESDE|nr:RIO1 family protein [Oesophagostomum dentatum]
MKVEKSLPLKSTKTSLTEFKNRSEYVKDDFRFKNPRGVLKIWAEREFMNLTRMAKVGLPCPVPVKLKRHLLVMSLIGEQGVAAPRLKNIDWEFYTLEERKDIYQQVQDIMCRMYKECNLVHGDLSEFNLLLAEGKVYVIDVSQAMDLSHPRNLHYLTRDIENVLAFFQKLEIPDLPTSVALFNLITDLAMSEEESLLVQVEQFSEDNRAHQINKSKPADFEWAAYNKEKKELRGESPAREYN